MSLSGMPHLLLCLCPIDKIIFSSSSLVVVVVVGARVPFPKLLRRVRSINSGASRSTCFLVIGCARARASPNRRRCSEMRFSALEMNR